MYLFGRHRQGLALALLLLVIVSSGCGRSTGTSGSGGTGPIKIGVILGLTGPTAALGQADKDGIELAVAEINAAGGVNQRRLELVVLDDQSKPDVAVSLAQKLVKEERVAAILGGSFGSTANAIAAFVERQKIPLVTPTGIVTDDQLKLQYSFFTLPNFEDVAKALLNQAKKQGLKRLGLLRLSRDFGQIGSRFINAQAASYGIQVVAEEQGADGDTDFTAQLTKIRAKEPDFMIVWFGNPAGAIALKNMKQLGMNLPALAPSSMANKALIDVGKEAVTGVVVQSNIAAADPLDRQKSFVSAFTKKFNKDPEAFEAVGYDMAKILAAAMSKVSDPTDGSAVKGALEKLQYSGAGVVVNFSPENHQPDPATILLTRVSNGKFLLVK